MSLTYQDALELKEVGFNNFKNDPSSYQQIGSLGNYQGMILIPTLEELIEACGDGFYALERNVGNPFDYTNKPDTKVWWSIKKADDTLLAVGESGTFGFDSPIQAVKNLYCALNKVDNT